MISIIVYCLFFALILALLANLGLATTLLLGLFVLAGFFYSIMKYLILDENRRKIEEETFALTLIWLESIGALDTEVLNAEIEYQSINSSRLSLVNKNNEDNS